MSCDLCFTRSSFSNSHLGLKLCIACIDELEELSCYKLESKALEWSMANNRSLAKIDSLFWYSGIVRNLTINAKVKGDISALNRILQIWNAELDADAIKDIDAVIPCPSSLWSRIHGRIDIAWFLAAKIAQKHRIKFLRPPRAIYWNMKKRSQTERPLDTTLVVPEEPTKLITNRSQNHCLILDDVVTTGTTLKTCIEHASKLNFHTFTCLTFARAR
jgi:predicted amidophosphoribosyltransferase